jgi:hypothetical protein
MTATAAMGVGETASSATPAVRIGSDQPHETDSASHGAD